MKKEPFAQLFDELHHANDEVDQARAVLDKVLKAQRQVRNRIWDAINSNVDTQENAKASDLREVVTKLQALVLELLQRLPPTS